MEVREGPENVDRETLFRLLRESYWAADRPREVIERSLAGSLCLSAWANGQMVGFARVVTDRATFCWLCDVIVDPSARGAGVGKHLVEAALGHPDLVDVRWMLATKDAHTLYEQYGFRREMNLDKWMTKGFKANVCGD